MSYEPRVVALTRHPLVHSGQLVIFQRLSHTSLTIKWEPEAERKHFKFSNDHFTSEI